MSADTLNLLDPQLDPYDIPQPRPAHRWDNGTSHYRGRMNPRRITGTEEREWNAHRDLEDVFGVRVEEFEEEWLR